MSGFADVVLDVHTSCDYNVPEPSSFIAIPITSYILSNSFYYSYFDCIMYNIVYQYTYVCLYVAGYITSIPLRIFFSNGACQRGHPCVYIVVVKCNLPVCAMYV